MHTTIHTTVTRWATWAPTPRQSNKLDWSRPPFIVGVPA
jgi:hypothetical protein